MKLYSYIELIMRYLFSSIKIILLIFNELPKNTNKPIHIIPHQYTNNYTNLQLLKYINSYTNIE